MTRACMRCWIASTALLLVSSTAEATPLHFVPSSFSVFTEDEFVVGVRINDLTDAGAPSLSAFDLDVNFEPTVVQFAGLTFADPVLGDQLDLFGLGSIQNVLPGDGVVNLFQLSLDTPWNLNQLQAGQFILATLRFDAIGAGESPLTFAVNTLADAEGNPLTADVVGTAVVTVTKIPEPSTLVLLGSGLVAILSRWLAALSSSRTTRPAGGGRILRN